MAHGMRTLVVPHRSVMSEPSSFECRTSPSRRCVAVWQLCSGLRTLFGETKQLGLLLRRPKSDWNRLSAISVTGTVNRAPRHSAFSQLPHLGLVGASARFQRSPIGVWPGGPAPREEISTHGSDRGYHAPWMQTAALLATNGARTGFVVRRFHFCSEPLVGTVECAPANSNFLSPWRDICPRPRKIWMPAAHRGGLPLAGADPEFLSVAHGSAHHARYAPPTHLESDRWTLASSC